MSRLFLPQSATNFNASYREFFNILARYSNGELKHYETIHPYHNDWREICDAAPYLVFDHEQSQFNLNNPLHVATYTGTKGPFETWHSSQDRQVKRLETLLFPQSAPRRLRINISPAIPNTTVVDERDCASLNNELDLSLMMASEAR
jgi:hypothetical protein